METSLSHSPKVLYNTKGETPPSVTNFPHQFYNFIEKAMKNKNEEHPFTIHAFRVLLIILSVVKKDQLIKSSQLELFDNDWHNTNKGTNDQVQFFFKLKDLIPKGSKNYHHAKDGLSFYVNFVLKENFVINGNKVSLEGSIINNLVYNEGQNKGVKFYMHSYWYKEFLDISRYYNKIATETIFTISTLQSYFFYLFLLKLEKKDDPGFIDLKLETLNEKFMTNYKHWSKAEDCFLKPIKSMLDRNAERSFNYTIGVNSVRIIAYLTSKIAPNQLSDEEYKVQKTMRYKRLKYKLNDMQANTLSVLYKTYSYGIVHMATSRKKHLKDLKGQEYILAVHALISNYVKIKDS